MLSASEDWLLEDQFLQYPIASKRNDSWPCDLLVDIVLGSLF